MFTWNSYTKGPGRETVSLISFVLSENFTTFSPEGKMTLTSSKSKATKSGWLELLLAKFETSSNFPGGATQFHLGNSLQISQKTSHPGPET